MGVVENGSQSLTGVIKAESLFDEPAFALEGGGFEVDAEGMVRGCRC